MEDKSQNNNEKGTCQSGTPHEKKGTAIILGSSQPQKAQSEGRTPIVIKGCGNNITVIERQYNDRSAVETVKSMLAADKAQGEFVRDLTGKIMEHVSNLMPKRMPEPTDQGPQPSFNAPVKKTTEDEKREERNKRQRERRADSKKVSAKKAPVKKATKKR